MKLNENINTMTCLLWFGFSCRIRWFKWVLYINGSFLGRSKQIKSSIESECTSFTLSTSMLAKWPSQALSLEKFSLEFSFSIVEISTLDFHIILSRWCFLLLLILSQDKNGLDISLHLQALHVTT